MAAIDEEAVCVPNDPSIVNPTLTCFDYEYSAQRSLEIHSLIRN